jgi:hypothetical protein
LRKKREEEEKLGATAKVVEVTDEEALKIQEDIDASKVNILNQLKLIISSFVH